MSTLKSDDHPISGGGYDAHVESKIAVLEQIAKNTNETLNRLERRLEMLDDRQRTDFRVLFGAVITTTLALAGLVAHGFHWL